MLTSLPYAKLFDVRKNLHFSVQVSGSTPNIASGLGRARGPNPLTADPQVRTESTPGIGVIKVTQGGKSGKFETVAPSSPGRFIMVAGNAVTLYNVSEQ